MEAATIQKMLTMYLVFCKAWTGKFYLLWRVAVQLTDKIERQVAQTATVDVSNHLSQCFPDRMETACMGNKGYVVAIKTQLATEETRRTGEIISTGVEKEKKEKDKKNWLCQRKMRGGENKRKI